MCKLPHSHHPDEDREHFQLSPRLLLHQYSPQHLFRHPCVTTFLTSLLHWIVLPVFELHINAIVHSTVLCLTPFRKHCLLNSYRQLCISGIVLFHCCIVFHHMSTPRFIHFYLFMAIWVLWSGFGDFKCQVRTLFDDPMCRLSAFLSCSQSSDRLIFYFNGQSIQIVTKYS